MFIICLKLNMVKYILELYNMNSNFYWVLLFYFYRYSCVSVCT